MRHRDEPKVAVTIVAAQSRKRSPSLRPFADALHCADAAVRLRVDQRFRREDAVYTELTLLFFTTPNWLFSRSRSLAAN